MTVCCFEAIVQLKQVQIDVFILTSGKTVDYSSPRTGIIF